MAYKDLDKYEKRLIETGGAILFLFGSYLGFNAINKGIKKREALKQIQQMNQSVIYSGQDYHLGTIAAQIYDSFYNNDWFGWTENEKEAIRLLKSIPPDLFPELQNNYFTLYQKNLKNDFIKYLTPEQLQEVAEYF